MTTVTMLTYVTLGLGDGDGRHAGLQQFGATGTIIEPTTPR
jgi:hypothetical protein